MKHTCLYGTAFEDVEEYMIIDQLIALLCFFHISRFDFVSTNTEVKMSNRSLLSRAINCIIIIVYDLTYFGN